MVFESKTCLHVGSISKPQIHEKQFLNFPKWSIFFNSLLFSGKITFFQISADFETGFKKFLFHLKAHQTRMQIDEINFFVAQVAPVIYAKSKSFKISQMCIFVTYCILKYVPCYFMNFRHLLFLDAQISAKSLNVHTKVLKFLSKQVFFQLVFS